MAPWSIRFLVYAWFVSRKVHIHSDAAFATASELVLLNNWSICSDISSRGNPYASNRTSSPYKKIVESCSSAESFSASDPENPKRILLKLSLDSKDRSSNSICNFFSGCLPLRKLLANWTSQDLSCHSRRHEITSQLRRVFMVIVSLCSCLAISNVKIAMGDDGKLAGLNVICIRYIYKSMWIYRLPMTIIIVEVVRGSSFYISSRKCERPDYTCHA